MGELRHKSLTSADVINFGKRILHGAEVKISTEIGAEVHSLVPKLHRCRSYSCGTSIPRGTVLMWAWPPGRVRISVRVWSRHRLRQKFENTDPFNSHLNEITCWDRFHNTSYRLNDLLRIFLEYGMILSRILPIFDDGKCSKWIHVLSSPLQAFYHIHR